MKIRYFCIIACIALGFVNVKELHAQYCTPAYTQGCVLFDDHINNFSLSNLNHLNSGCSPTAYSDYTTSQPTINLSRGMTYSWTATLGNGTYTYHIGIWIDYNKNQNFNEFTEAFIYNNAFESFASGTFTVPLTAPLGTTRLRIRNRDAVEGPIAWNHSCQLFDYGEAHDYTVNIMEAPMAFSSTTASHTNLDHVMSSSTNQEILRLNVVTTGTASPISVNALHFSTTGTTDTADITAARVFYTGSSATFATTNQFGATNNIQDTTIEFTGAQALNNGDNYFWLVYDIDSLAPDSNVVDAVYDSIGIGTSYYSPTVSNPAGERVIRRPLKGTYTIGPAADYASFTEAVGALTAYGIDSNVVFEVIPNSGPYTEQIIIPSINGATPQHTITFNGNGDTLRFQPTTSANRHVIRLNSAAHLRFENMTIMVDAASTWGWAVHLLNSCENIRLSNVTVHAAPSNGTNDINGVIGSNSNTAYNVAGVSVNDFVMEQCTIIGGYNGLRLNGGTTSYLTGIEVNNSVFQEQTHYPIYFYYVDAPLVRGNDMSRKPASTGTINGGIIRYLNISGAFDISQNRMYNAPRYIMYIENAAASAANPSTIVNNMIGGGFSNLSNNSACIRLLGTSNYINIYHNNLNYDISGGGAAMKITTTSVTDLDVRNNSFVFSGTGDSYAIYYSNGGTHVNAHDYNNYHSTGNNFVYYSGNRSNLAALQAVNNPPNNDMNSISGDPAYASGTDLTITTTFLANKGATIGVTEDFFGNPRDTSSPTIGAHEFFFDNDARVAAILSPVDNSCGDTAGVIEVVVVNIGDLEQSDIPLQVDVSGDFSVTYNDTIAGPLSSGQMDTVSVGPINTLNGGTMNITAYTILDGDEQPGNDTLLDNMTILPAAGTPTDPSGPNRLCQGAGASIYTTSATNATGYTWTVSGAGNTITATSDTATVDWDAGFSGTAQVCVTAENGCSAGPVCTDVDVTSLPPGTPSDPAGVTTLCQGTDISTYTTSASNATSYTWTVSGAGNTIAGTGDTATVEWDATFSGTAQVCVTAENGCGAEGPVCSPITINPLPIAGFGYQIDILTASFADSSQNATSWYWEFGDGENSTDPDPPQHTYPDTGTYNVMLVATNACASDTVYDTIALFFTSIGEPSGGAELSVYPNPATDKLEIRLTLPQPEAVGLTMYNLLGEEVLSYENNAPATTSVRHVVDLTDWVGGVYFVKVQMRDEILVQRVVVVRQ